jgi:citrate lyase subunit beta / citryl-CoA lyase
MQPLSSWMFVPGHQQKMIDKALGLKLDVVIFDLEDGVPPAEKDTARNLIAQALARPAGVPLRFVRIHAIGHNEMERDIQAVIRPGLDGLVLPKVETPEDVCRIDEILKDREPKSGQVRLLATIESARGLIQAPAIAAASPRLIGLMFGAEDFALDLGIFGDPGDLLYARSALVVAAASERLQAIDRVYTDIQNPDGLIRDTRQARELGFTGKGLIHPAQIEPVHKVFRPTAEEIEYARRVVEAFEKTEGAIAVDGKMVDLPIVERARRVLQLMGEQT